MRAHTPRPARRYVELAERFRATPHSMTDAELVELRAYADAAGNHLLERRCAGALNRSGGVVLTIEHARVVRAALEIVREDDHHYGLVAPIAMRAGRQGMDVMLVVDAVIDLIQDQVI